MRKAVRWAFWTPLSLPCLVAALQPESLVHRMIVLLRSVGRLTFLCNDVFLVLFLVQGADQAMRGRSHSPRSISLLEECGNESYHSP